MSDTTADPADRVALDESVTMAFLVVLDAMTPAERVAFVLHDVFKYPFAEVAEIVGRSPAACRQLATAARRRLRAGGKPVTPVERSGEIVRNFKEAWQAKNIDALVGLLDPEAVTVPDGGGLVRARIEPVRGGEQIARAVIDIADIAPDMALVERTVNGRPGLVGVYRDAVVAVFAFDVVDDRIRHIWAIRNPEKLTLWAATE